MEFHNGIPYRNSGNSRILTDASFLWNFIIIIENYKAHTTNTSLSYGSYISPVYLLHIFCIPPSDPPLSLSLCLIMLTTAIRSFAIPRGSPRTIRSIFPKNNFSTDIKPSNLSPASHAATASKNVPGAPPKLFSFINTDEFKIAMTATLVTIISVVVGAKLNESANIALPADALKKQVDDAAKAFAESELKLEIGKDDKHVKRVEVEKAIQDMANQPLSQMKIAVICGRQEVGKSESTVVGLNGRKGVIRARIGSGSVITDKTVKELICLKVGLGQNADHFEALMKATFKTLGTFPIIIIEIGNGVTDPLAIRAAEDFAKECCCDRAFPCMVYIVPSDNTSTDLLKESNTHRLKFIWVGPMNDEEGEELLGKFPQDFKIFDTGLKAIDDADACKARDDKGCYKELFKIVGTHTADLKGLALTSKDKRQLYVENLERAGSTTWKNFDIELASSLGSDEVKEMRKGMKNLSELLLNSGEDGIPVSKVKPPAQEAKKVNAFMKERGIVRFIYHPPSQSYRFRNYL